MLCYCKGGVPVDLRPWVWFEISGASALKASLPPAYYSDLVAASNQGCTCQRQIELDSTVGTWHAFYLRRIKLVFPYKHGSAVAGVA
eukprot:scaffold177071_cov18-Tisochrysis_lutea.AAC.1